MRLLQWEVLAGTWEAYEANRIALYQRKVAAIAAATHRPGLIDDEIDPARLVFQLLRHKCSCSIRIIARRRPS